MLPHERAGPCGGTPVLPHERAGPCGGTPVLLHERAGPCGGTPVPDEETGVDSLWRAGGRAQVGAAVEYRGERPTSDRQVGGDWKLCLEATVGVGFSGSEDGCGL